MRPAIPAIPCAGNDEATVRGVRVVDGLRSVFAKSNIWGDPLAAALERRRLGIGAVPLVVRVGRLLSVQLGPPKIGPEGSNSHFFA